MQKNITPRFPDYEWYCVHCHELLNSQVGFDDNKYSWKCTNCNHKNSISKDNLRKPYAYLKNPTTTATFASVIKGIIRAVYGFVSRTALYFFIAFITIIGTKKSTINHLSLGLINPLYKEDFFCAALYLSGAIFLATLLIYAIVKRSIGRPNSKKHFIRETIYFLRDNILYPIEKIKSLFKKTNIIDKVLSVMSFLIFLATVILLVYGCMLWV